MSNARNISKADSRFVNATGDTISGDVEVLDPVSSSFTSSVKIGSVGSNRRLVLSQDDVLNYSIGGSGTGSKTHIVSGGTAGAGTTRMTVDDSGRVTTPYQPSMAAHSQGVSAVAYNGTPYIPAVVSHNVGNHYNASTGTFTCPVAGKYLCTFQFLINTPNTTSHAAVHWEKNGSRNGSDAHTEYHSSRSYEPLSLSWIIDASQNDAITLWVDTNEGAAIYQGQYSNMSIRLLG